MHLYLNTCLLLAAWLAAEPIALAQTPESGAHPVGVNSVPDNSVPDTHSVGVAHSQVAPLGGSEAALEAASPPAVDAGPVATPRACVEPPGLVAAGCHCYSLDELKKLAGAITELTICRAAMMEKDALIRERLVEPAHLAPAPAPAWWQSPGVIIGGVVVTAGVTGFLVAAAMSR